MLQQIFYIRALSAAANLMTMLRVILRVRTTAAVTAFKCRVQYSTAVACQTLVSAPHEAKNYENRH